MGPAISAVKIDVFEKIAKSAGLNRKIDRLNTGLFGWTDGTVEAFVDTNKGTFEVESKHSTDYDSGRLTDTAKFKSAIEKYKKLKGKSSSGEEALFKKYKGKTVRLPADRSQGIPEEVVKIESFEDGMVSGTVPRQYRDADDRDGLREFDVNQLKKAKPV